MVRGTSVIHRNVDHRRTCWHMYIYISQIVNELGRGGITFYQPAIFPASPSDTSCSPKLASTLGSSSVERDGPDVLKCVASNIDYRWLSVLLGDEGVASFLPWGRKWWGSSQMTPFLEETDVHNKSTINIAKGIRQLLYSIQHGLLVCACPMHQKLIIFNAGISLCQNSILRSSNEHVSMRIYKYISIMCNVYM